MSRRLLLLAALSLPTAVAAQEKPRDGRPMRVRVSLGPQLVPGFPGSNDMRLRPLIGVSRARGDEPFAFGGPADGSGVAVVNDGRLAVGPAFRFEGRRTREDAGGGLTEVGRTIELGGFAAYWVGSTIRLRGDVRKGLGGHKGWVGTVGADYVARDADRWLWSLGPRVTLADGRRERAYFGVDADSAARTGLPRYMPGSGVESVGAAARVSYAFTPTWGIHAQGLYARLVDGAGRSPVVRRIGSHDQVTVGAALSYTFMVR